MLLRCWHAPWGCPSETAPSRAPTAAPGGVFMLSIPVRSKMSYWTSLGNFNVLKRHEKEKKTPTSRAPRRARALHGCITRAITAGSLSEFNIAPCSAAGSVLPVLSLQPPADARAPPGPRRRSSVGTGGGAPPGVTRGRHRHVTKPACQSAVPRQYISGAGATLAQLSRPELGGPRRWSVSFLPKASAHG